MNIRTSFRTKLLLLTIAPLAIVQAVTLFAVMRTVQDDVDTRARDSLVIGGKVVAEFLDTRATQLGTSVEVLAADFGLKQAAATRDAETIRSVLANHSERVSADLAFYLDTDGEPLASTLGSAFPADDVTALQLSASLGPRTTQSTLKVGDTIYHTVSVPLLAPVQIGWVIAGFAVDESLLNSIRELTGLDVSVETGRSQPAHRVYLVDENSNEWLTLNVPFVDRRGDVDIVLRRSLQEAMLPYEQARAGLVAFGLMLLALVALAAAYLSGSAARPLRELTDAAKRMISGNYDQAVSVSSDDDFGELAKSFNAMRTAIAEREERISHQAMHDPVTGLPNRSHITNVLHDLILDANETPVSVLCVRLLRMNSISSTLGHSASDEVRTLAAKHLQLNLHDDEVLGHAGTNEFVLISPDCDLPGARATADRIDGILGAGVTLGRVNIALQTEIGIAEYPKHGQTAAELLRNASIARSEASENREAVAIYEPGREDHYVQQLRIINDLRSALQREEIFLCYQPKVSLPDGQFAGAEALVRWRHPELGLLMPDTFIPPAEQAGTIVHLTRYVLSRALAQCRSWNERGIAGSVAINLSARDLQDDYLPYHVLQELKDQGVAPDRLTLEITENSVMQDINHSIAVLEVLRDIGVRISVDDFGTGHSSLAQLRNLPVHELKIDKSFIMSLMESAEDKAIVRATIELAHNLDLDVVAEGVENEDTLRRLSGLACEQAQGYFISKPVSGEALAGWYESYKPVRFDERRRKNRAFADSA